VSATDVDNCSKKMARERSGRIDKSSGIESACSCCLTLGECARRGRVRPKADVERVKV